MKGLRGPPGTGHGEVGFPLLRKEAEEAGGSRVARKRRRRLPGAGMVAVTLIPVPPSVEGEAARWEGCAGLDPEQSEQDSAPSWSHVGGKENRREVGSPGSSPCYLARRVTPGARCCNRLLFLRA